MIMRKLYTIITLHIIEQNNSALKKFVQEQEQKQALVAKQKRISQLQADIQNLLRKNAELKQELLAKDMIIKQQVIMLGAPK